MEKKKSGKRANRQPSIDGIVGGSRQLGAPVHPSYQPSRDKKTPTLDNFIRQSQGPLGEADANLSATASAKAEDAERDALLDEPIVLDEDDYSKKKKDWRKKQRPSRLRKVLKRTALALLILLLAGGAFLGYKFYKTQRHVLAGGGHAPAVCDGDVSPDLLSSEGNGRVNVLLLGIGGEGHEGPDLTDTVMIASIDPVNDKVDLLSIPRDLWVKIPADGQHKINQAYADAKSTSDARDLSGQIRDGVKTMDATLENVLGIPIHYHAVIDFAAFKDIVDALGGVDLNVTKEGLVYEVLWVEGTSQHYTLNVQPGLQHFDGMRALYYARSRQTSTRGDFDRSERQRALLVAIKDKALSLGTFSNPIKISDLLDSLGKNVYTDFDSSSIKCLYKQISEVKSENITSVDLVTPPHDLLTTGSYGGISIVRPKLGLFDYSAVQNYVRNTLRDSFIAKENSAIAIYNATSTAGVATAAANVLKSYGYNVTTVANAPNLTNPAATVLVDLSDGKDKYTRNYLERRYSVAATGKIPSELNITPPAGTRFVIILGKDAAANL